MTDTTTTATPASTGWSEEERRAMKEYAAELKKAKGRGGKLTREQGELDVLEKLAELPEPDRSMGERIHSIVKDVAPQLVPRTWYGLPAYANEKGKVICFFTPASKFKERYASFGFNADAHLDEGTMWPTAWAITAITPEVERQIASLVKKAVS